MLREFDLLIIDEISMVRCDTLDAIDLVLRRVRGSRQPFGDVQVVLIGEIEVHEVLPAEMIHAVIAFLESHGDASLTEIRTGTGDHFDYNDLRMIVAQWSRARGATDRKRA